MRPVLDPASLVVPQPTVELRYHYHPGLELRYRSSLAVFRSADASPRFATKNKEDYVSDVRYKIVEQDPADEGFYLLAYHTPVERQLDGRPAPLGGPRIIYIKHNAQGELIESSDPAEASTLLLPAAAVGPGSEWKVSQPYFPQGRTTPLQVVSLYRVNALEGSHLEILFDSQELLYHGDTPATEANVYTLVGKGRFRFDVEAGHVVSLETESTMTSKEDDLLLEVVALHTMSLSD